MNKPLHIDRDALDDLIKEAIEKERKRIYNEIETLTDGNHKPLTPERFTQDVFKIVLGEK